MNARSPSELSLPGHGGAVALRAIARDVLKILCIAAVAAAVLGVRYLVFEYNHGGRQVVLQLLDSLMP